MPGENRECAVELLGKHCAGKFVRERERGKRKFLRGATAKGFGETLGSAAQENNFARTAVARVTKPFRKLRGRLIFSSVIEQDNSCGGIECQLAQRRRRILTQFGDLRVGKSFEARDLIVDLRADFRSTCFFEHDEMYFHFGCITASGPAAKAVFTLANLCHG